MRILFCFFQLEPPIQCFLRLQNHLFHQANGVRRGEFNFDFIFEREDVARNHDAVALKLAQVGELAEVFGVD